MIDRLGDRAQREVGNEVAATGPAAVGGVPAAAVKAAVAAALEERAGPFLVVQVEVVASARLARVGRHGADAA
jgi:hypothetical protein